jgi:hypothetical protein
LTKIDKKLKGIDYGLIGIKKDRAKKMEIKPG